MLQRILLCALAAGAAASLLLSALHVVFTTPLILEAEVYESAAEEAALAGVVVAHSHGEGHAAAAGEAGDGWAPTDGVERTLYTVLATLISAVGFALVLVGAAVLVEGRLTIRTGFLWGLAGFAATGMATSLGLAPELPGAVAGDLALRQAWWIGTAAATAVGLGLIVFARPGWAKAAGIALLALPHVIGAPHPEAFGSMVPAEISALFAARSLVLQGLLWVAIGIAAGWVWQRMESTASAGAAERA